MTPSRTDVLIVGAGAAGLTLAIDLARRGVDFRLVDKAPAPFAGSRGKGLQPRSQEVFEDLGVLADLLARGAAPYPLIRTYGDGGFVDQAMGEVRAPTPAEPFGGPLMLPQMLTEQALRDRLTEFGRAPEYGCELASFDDGPEGVVARLIAPRGEAVVHARWLIGADGGRSFVRQALSVAFPGETLPIRGLVADLKVSGLSREVWHRWMGGDEGQVSLCPLAGTDLFQLQAALQQPGDPDLSAAGLSALLARRTGRDDLVVSGVAWASAFGMNARLAERYRVGHVLLVGDAAHVHPPTGGQGLNTSVQDAYNLGWKLAAVLGAADEDLIDTYEEERRPIAASVLGLSQALLSSTQSGAMRRGRESQELDLTYAGSRLALDLRPAPGRVMPGNRAPDAPLAGGRLFERMAGPHWTLIGHEVGPEGTPSHPGLVVVSPADGVGQALAEIYDLSPATWVLIRPDGYIGAIAPAGHEGALGTYLARISPVAGA